MKKFNINKIIFTVIISFSILCSINVKAQAFTDAVIDSATTLPIKLRSFNAYKVEKDVHVNWVIEASKNVIYYEVHRSFNGFDFETIATIKATTSSNYTFVDKNVPGKTLYYRIVSVDLDGQINFSSIAMLKHDNSTLTDVSIFPNPVLNGSFNLSFKNLPITNYNFSIKDSKGTLVFTKSIHISSLNTSLFVELPRNLPKGFYIMQIHNSKGFIDTKKLIIN